MYNGVHFSLDGPDPANIRVIDHGALGLISKMTTRGIRVDIPFLRALDLRITTRQREIEEAIPGILGNAYTDFDGKRHAPFSIGSSDHVARLLFKHLELAKPGEVKLTKGKKREAVDDDVLSLLENRHLVVPAISEWRELNKLHTTYTGDDCIIALVVDGRVHTDFTTTVAATGRLSSRRPNLQNIPTRTKLGAEVRNAFIADPGWRLLSVDLSQIEMRWAAHRSKDATMMSVFWNKEDVHTRTTCNVFGLDYKDVAKIAAACDNSIATTDEMKWYKAFKKEKRLPCKTVGFGVLYGQSEMGLQSSLATEGVYWTEDECKDLIENKFFAVYPGLRDMLARDHATARRYAMIWDDFGRVRLVPEAKSTHRWISDAGIRKAGNHPEQSGAQNGLKLAMAELNDVLLPDFEGYLHPLLQIHDEIILGVHPDVDEQAAFEVTEIMKNAVPLDVPVESSSDIAERWGELK